MKYKWTIFYILLVSLSGCQRVTLIKNENIKKIEITDLTGTNTLSEEITDQHQIAYVVGELNDADKELAKFVADYKLRIIYENAPDVLVICNGRYIKINGVAYELDRPIKDILK